MHSDSLIRSHAPLTARRMADAAAQFLASLTSSQRAVAQFPFAADERFVWTYTPEPRKGLRLRDMTPQQRTAAQRLLDVGLSARGADKARDIIALETILRETERIEGVVTSAERDPELYYFSVFGEPAGNAPWGWRVNGHHLALLFTIVADELVSPTPLFFGANPAEVRHGAEKGLRTLAAEEDLARAFLAGLEPSQKTLAIVDPVAPHDILTKNYRVIDPSSLPQGIRYAALSGEQRGQLLTLIRNYIEYSASELCTNAWTRIEQAGLDAITFAWAGSEERGTGHYYAVRGPTFAIEYDNTQNNANHIHSVWRDFANDFGLDLLAHHYATAHARESKV